MSITLDNSPIETPEGSLATITTSKSESDLVKDSLSEILQRNLKNALDEMKKMCADEIYRLTMGNSAQDLREVQDRISEIMQSIKKLTICQYAFLQTQTTPFEEVELLDLWEITGEQYVRTIIRAAMRAAGIKQCRFAELLPCTTPWLSQYFTSDSGIRFHPSLLKKMSAVVGADFLAAISMHSNTLAPLSGQNEKITLVLQHDPDIERIVSELIKRLYAINKVRR